MRQSINCRGLLIDLSTPIVMGILNATPDSFYAQSRQQQLDGALQTVEKMLDDGATFIDIGGYSTRPGAEDISVNEELERVIPVINALQSEFPDVLISIDTFRGKVAREAVAAGAVIINDISGYSLDDDMLPTVVDLNVPYILMHMRGNPQTMVAEAIYKDVTGEVIHYFSQKINALNRLGVKDIIIDPGFGFAKKPEHSFELLKNLEQLQIFGLPILAGLSRKSMIYKTLETNAENALNGTTVLNTISIKNGAKILRVHDVREAVETIRLCEMLIENY
jgi:dihydropteroate synthase